MKNDPILFYACLASFIQFAVETGARSFVWFGPSPRLNISDPELIKEILTKTSVFQKPRPDPIGQTIVGGLLFLEDEKWATHRKIINSAFHLEKLKVTNHRAMCNVQCSILEFIKTLSFLLTENDPSYAHKLFRHGKEMGSLGFLQRRSN